METGTSNTDATSKTDTKTKTSSINAGAEVSVGWGPFSASVKENNLLPKEIIINNDLVSFLGELIVSKNSSQLKSKTEEIETF